LNLYPFAHCEEHLAQKRSTGNVQWKCCSALQNEMRRILHFVRSIINEPNALKGATPKQKIKSFLLYLHGDFFWLLFLLLLLLLNNPRKCKTSTYLIKCTRRWGAESRNSDSCQMNQPDV